MRAWPLRDGADPVSFDTLRVRQWFFVAGGWVLRLWSSTFGRFGGRESARESDAHAELAVWWENDERFRWFVTSTRDLLFELRLDGHYLYVSPHCESITGYTRDEFLGRSAYDIVHPDDREIAAATMFAAIAGSGPVEFTARYRHKSGGYRWYEGYRQAYRKSPFDVRVITIARDVTDRKTIEEAARRSEERLLLHIARTPVAVIGWDGDGKIASWNPAAASIFGYTAGEAVGQDGDALLTPQANGQNAGVRHGRSTDATNRHVTQENSTKAGRNIICEWNDTPLVEPDGSIVGVTSIVQDVTDRVLAQEAVRDSEAAIRSLYELTCAPQTDVRERIDLVLAMGCAFFHLPLSLVTRIDGDEAELIAAHVPGDGLKPGLRRGMRLPLASMYSSRIVANGETVAIDRESEEFWTSFALHEQVRVRSFIGTPVHVRGSIHGTISFAAPEPRDAPFTETEIDFIRLIAQWLGLAIERQII